MSVKRGLSKRRMGAALGHVHKTSLQTRTESDQLGELKGYGVRNWRLGLLNGINPNGTFHRKRNELFYTIHISRQTICISTSRS